MNIEDDIDSPIEDLELELGNIVCKNFILEIRSMLEK